MDEKIILVDKYDKKIGFEEKLKVHEKGLLHRAFSILVFNDKNELLIQKRAKDKYHSEGLWSNTCCSHQRENENLKTFIHKRLTEEMGFDCKLLEIFNFQYTTKFKNHLIENEYDHVFIGFYKGDVTPNTQEVKEYKWILLKDLKKDVEKNPKYYSYWFKLILKKIDDKYIDNILV